MTKPSITPPAPRRLSVRLAQNSADLVAVQRLRWRVFYAECGAQATDADAPMLDADRYDALCDHLLVIDADLAQDQAVVGTYRLLRESVAAAHKCFYSASEFDLAPLIASKAEHGKELLELGRSCVLPAYRTSGTIQLLWRGIADYIAARDIGLMFGCGSFHGTDPDACAAGLSYLHHHHRAPAGLRPRAHGADAVALERLPRGSYDERRALFQLPPLIKGYLRLGAGIGDGAYIDRAFNTIDVCVVMPVAVIAERYAARFSVAA